MSKKACKNCNLIYEGEKCPNCGSGEALENWKGHVLIIDPEKSEIAKKLNITKPGDYAIKTK